MREFCRLTRRVYFSAAMELDPHHVEGHNYILEAHVAGPVVENTGMIMSIRKLDEMISKVTRQLDHKFLNRDVPAFKSTLPSLENLAVFCYGELVQQFSNLNEIRLNKVRLYESEDLWVDYGPRLESDII